MSCLWHAESEETAHVEQLALTDLYQSVLWSIETSNTRNVYVVIHHLVSTIVYDLILHP